jgi:hypothetical protein
LDPIFAFFLNFQQENLKIKYFPHLKFENNEINSIKFDSSRVFQQQQERLIPMHFFVLILFNFH